MVALGHKCRQCSLSLPLGSASLCSGSIIGHMLLYGKNSIRPLPYNRGQLGENSKYLMAPARVALGCMTLTADRKRTRPGESPIHWVAMGPVLLKLQGLQWERLILQGTSRVGQGCKLENTFVETDVLLLRMLCPSRHKIFPKGKDSQTAAC